MKRFYEEATALPAPGGFEIRLDGRGVKTPVRRPLIVPTRALGDAVAAEWNAQGENVDPRAMPLTGLANAAIDRVSADPEGFAAGLARYADSDLLCYRADGPAALVSRQATQWDPLLEWARRRFDVDFHVAAGIVHRPQPPGTLNRLGHAVAGYCTFELAALSPLVTISGSLIVALALAERAVGLDAAWKAAALDEAWQAERWGDDPEAALALANRRRDFEAAERFLRLLEA